MKDFATLLDRLSYTPSRNDKLKLLADYFAAAPDPDRGYALAALTDGLFFRLPLRRILSDLLVARVDPVLFDLSRDYVGDTAETIALIWPAKDARGEPPRLATVVETVQSALAMEVPSLLAGWLDRLDATGRWALLKLLTGALRVGVSARLAKTALAEWSGVPLSEIEEVWHGLKPPFLPLFAWLSGEGPRPEGGATPVFRPLMLSHQIEDKELGTIVPQEFVAEWKWDGIRVQAAHQGGERRLFSRTGDDISGAFPDVVAGLPEGVVLDGELLVVRGNSVAPFNDLQQRLNRKTVTEAMLKSHPAHIRLYDMLFEGDEDLRVLPFIARRMRLETWHKAKSPPRTDVSPIIAFESIAELEALWAGARETGIEGLMLKRRDSPYIAGRPKGHWYKWKRAPLTFDAVLMYAQRGSGKRSSYYSDYTFGAWRAGANGEPELVPVGKSYFGFTDEELKELDAFVRNHTVDSFGPVRQVEPKLVFEVAFDSVHRSTRHKSGVAMRFPRINRIRWDKPAEEADRLETLQAMIVE
ncbi:cisplatin damage response ATP-dependent DNA ligase [Methyloceanibacter sp.]|uniref:cisplatin damage response ATP-dependent DNA ligase n=1 Tax=Methyloceanibacter sp. TaxID=1965321 RepID=UPI002D3F42A6|nr:cisplatin damage response ATP-dependent DNA ligase [Methyloceanibacter sp.]HZP10308.1 cisplatin damage response ATP-dependent DNA ligase [Methyloceanibacter sp.]